MRSLALRAGLFVLAAVAVAAVVLPSTSSSERSSLTLRMSDPAALLTAVPRTVALAGGQVESASVSGGLLRRRRAEFEVQLPYGRVWDLVGPLSGSQEVVRLRMLSPDPRDRILEAERDAARAAELLDSARADMAAVEDPSRVRPLAELLSRRLSERDAAEEVVSSVSASEVTVVVVGVGPLPLLGPLLLLLLVPVSATAAVLLRRRRRSQPRPSAAESAASPSDSTSSAAS